MIPQYSHLDPRYNIFSLLFGPMKKKHEDFLSWIVNKIPVNWLIGAFWRVYNPLKTLFTEISIQQVIYKYVVSVLFFLLFDIDVYKWCKDVYKPT